MAIKRKTEVGSLIYDLSYTRVEEIIFWKRNKIRDGLGCRAKAFLLTYSSKDLATSDPSSPIAGDWVEFDYIPSEGKNPWIAAYEAFKSSHELIDAEDV